MKRRTLPIVLNAVIPGAGLWYLGFAGMAIANLSLAVLIPLVGSFWFSEHVHWLFLAVAAGSAGVAHAMADQQAASQSTSHSSGSGDSAES